MNYTSELKKFATSQALFSGMRVALAVVIPSIILAYFGLLKEYFLFPLATSFVGLTDQIGPYIRRRNTLIFAITNFILVAAIASLLKDYTVFIYLEIIIFGIIYSMFGVYGQRLSVVGGISLVIFSVFVDGHLSGDDILKSILIFSAGCFWFLFIFLVVSKLQPYKLASQLIGENYIQLAEYLRLRAQFYKVGVEAENKISEVISQLSIIKTLQEDTREVLFKTRKIVDEATNQSRMLMLMFLTSIDFYEKLITTNTDFKKLQENFSETGILTDIHDHLLYLAEEVENVGIALQSGNKISPNININIHLEKVYQKYFQLRNANLNETNLEKYLSLRLVMMRIKEMNDEVKIIQKKWSQNEKIEKNISKNFDVLKFLPQEEKINFKIFAQNFSLKSSHFRHAIRLTVAMLLGYAISKFEFLGIGHSYWILITIIAIIRPAYSITKHRNLLRIYGTFAGALLAYLILHFVGNNTVLLTILFSSMILCFSLLKTKYAWAVFFMTIYIFISFNFLNPGNVNVIFKDRLVDTTIAGVLVFLVSLFIFPIWEEALNKPLMEICLKENLNYYKVVMENLLQNTEKAENYKLKRRDAIISLANLSDNFQRMLSDPKNHQERLEYVHQFVNTSHLALGYTASLSQFSDATKLFSKIDFNQWNIKILQQFAEIEEIFKNEEDSPQNSAILEKPKNHLESLLKIRKNEIEENEFFDKRDISKISMLAELNNITELLELLSEVLAEQKRISISYCKLL
ncbi:FUSC family protein [Frigoriflavimonas asaccharolytica]|uniref:Putative membrane protein YccC n=1 Tax=Frigoriflavimonas asaccharolytica TaxID=2735899 RepID=A0A8J8GB47_9FLAO|nr:FUSC family membrane protein [Frigoriflavimonas asaccharolytica]NRS93282.1 putative membrane protein YccC [Frigoriflavimonas asaccharolytica]